MVVTKNFVEKKTIDIKLGLWWFSSSYNFWEDKDNIEFWQLLEEEIKSNTISEHQKAMNEDIFIDITDL